MSNKFVPYRPNYDLVVSKLNNVGVTKTIIPFTASAADTYELITATKITLPAEKVLRITAGAIYQGTYATGIKLIRGTSIEHSKTLAISESTYDYNVLSTSSIYRASSNQDIYVALKCNAASTVNIVLAYDIL